LLNIIFGVFQILIAVGLIGFWLMFYFTEYKNRKMTEVEFKHEMSFPLPDLGWVLPNLIIASIGLLLEQWFGYLFTVTSASGMMFLGLIDLAFNLQNKKFCIKKYSFDAYMSIIIVAIMLIFGPVFLIYGGFNLLP
jgi:heme/copper-type cytochrome/quinol oxidase subunit 2